MLTQRQQHDVGHSVVATGRGVLRLSSALSAGVWTPAEKQLTFAFISPLPPTEGETSVADALLSVQK
ncbi:hypothetical protein [Lysinibacillus xylanilyticus]|uniref:hypothetical protein n=1 Tax=Lysinibacillus xylanilyticus TaxID=582475 RepID=UPI003CFFDD82